MALTLLCRWYEYDSCIERKDRTQKCKFLYILYSNMILDAKFIT
jgi:hypothetical protein